MGFAEDRVDLRLRVCRPRFKTCQQFEDEGEALAAGGNPEESPVLDATVNEVVPDEPCVLGAGSAPATCSGAPSAACQHGPAAPA